MLLMFADHGRGQPQRADMEHTKQTKAVNVERGLILVRYATAENESRSPKIRIVVNPKHKKSIELVLSPDHGDAVLWQTAAA